MRLRLDGREYHASLTPEGLTLETGTVIASAAASGAVLEGSEEEVVALGAAGYQLEDWRSAAGLQRALAAHRAHIAHLDARWQQQRR